jgi:hypothetical protein
MPSAGAMRMPKAGGLRRIKTAVEVRERSLKASDEQTAQFYKEGDGVNL